MVFFSSDKSIIKEEFIKYFKNVFTNNEECDMEVNMIRKLVDFRLTSVMAAPLIREVIEEEIKKYYLCHGQ